MTMIARVYPSDRLMMMMYLYQEQSPRTDYRNLPEMRLSTII